MLLISRKEKEKIENMLGDIVSVEDGSDGPGGEEENEKKYPFITAEEMLSKARERMEANDNFKD
ncbi:MAG: hypothetical protein ABJB76_05820 [Candidatus Nitrosocosmicus sp.]